MTAIWPNGYHKLAVTSPTTEAPVADSMTKTTLRLPTNLWKAAQHRAVDEDLDLQELVARAIKLYLKTEPREGGR